MKVFVAVMMNHLEEGSPPPREPDTVVALSEEDIKEKVLKYIIDHKWHTDVRLSEEEVRSINFDFLVEHFACEEYSWIINEEEV